MPFSTTITAIRKKTVEYDFGPLGKKDFVDISTENDSFYCCVDGKNILTKLAFATEILYLQSQKTKDLQKVSS